MKLSVEQVQELAALQREISKSYKQGGFINVDKNHIFMWPNDFLDTFGTFSVGVEEYNRDFPYYLTAVVDGALFVATASPKQLVEIEKTHPEAFDYISKAIQAETP